MSDHGLDLGDDFSTRRGAAFVVGGSGGLGSAISEELACRGANVALTYRTNEAVAQAVAERISDRGRAAWTISLDLNDHAAASAAIDTVAAAANGLHTVVYAAGPHVPQRYLSTIDPVVLRSQLATDAAGFFAVAVAALPHLRKSQGTLVAVTTAATRRYPPRDSLSSIPKAAVEATVRAIAAEEGRFGVRANTVGPGMIVDGMAERLMASGDLDAPTLDAARANTAMRSFGSAVDIAEAVCFLASSRARFITGQHLNVDGGFSL